MSRVTGGQQSVIDGFLQSKIDGANFYLLNPSVVLFGPNAILDVSGSFHVSTADFHRFADEAKFSAYMGQESVLTVASPTAFGFLGNNPAAITLQAGSLRVSKGKALSVAGGDVQVVWGWLKAPSGRIQLASMASPGEVMFSRLELAPDLTMDSFTHLGRLEVSQGTLIDASGNGDGTVLSRSGHLLVDRSQMFADNTGPAHGSGLSVDLCIATDSVIANAADVAMIGKLPWQPSTNRFTLLTTDDKILPRMRLLHANSLYQTASDPACSKLLGEKKTALKPSRPYGLD